MDSQQLHELATNARLNHWPPHLGVTTDAEKIEYLAQRLSEAADAEARADGLEDELTTAREENDMLHDLEDEIKTLKSDLKLAQTQLEQIREIVV